RSAVAITGRAAGCLGLCQWPGAGRARRHASTWRTILSGPEGDYRPLAHAARRSAPRVGGAGPRVFRYVCRSAGHFGWQIANGGPLAPLCQDKSPSPCLADRPLVAISRRDGSGRSAIAPRALVQAVAESVWRAVSRFAGPRAGCTTLVGAGPRAASDGIAR